MAYVPALSVSVYDNNACHAYIVLEQIPVGVGVSPIASKAKKIKAMS